MYIKLLESGDIRAALGEPDAATLQDISKDKWASTPAIIKGVTLDRVRLANRSIMPDFRECTCSGCVFDRVRTDSHFWGAGNVWKECVFQDARLIEVGSPANRFERCRFLRTEFLSYMAADTVYLGCTFTETSFLGLGAYVATTTSGHPELLALNEHLPWGSKTALGFIGCRFERCCFANSMLRNVLFAGCEMTDVTARTCDFTGVRSDRQWWPDTAQCDLYHALVDAMIETAAAACGPESVVAGKLQRAREDLRAGKRVDLTEVMYALDVPDSEIEALEPAKDKLYQQFARGMEIPSGGSSSAH